MKKRVATLRPSSKFHDGAVCLLRLERRPHERPLAYRLPTVLEDHLVHNTQPERERHQRLSRASFPHGRKRGRRERNGGEELTDTEELTQVGETSSATAAATATTICAFPAICGECEDLVGDLFALDDSDEEVGELYLEAG